MKQLIAKTLETKRLILRRWNEDDAEDLYRYAGDPDVGPIAGWPAHKSVNESRDVIKNVLNGHTNMTDRDDECEMGFWLGKPFWGQGIMPAAQRKNPLKNKGHCGKNICARQA